ncbi:hypothetical protein CXG81DRAFT_27015 [Caulochytrium protostelioides]|uniref:Uncharacterized protein n=1 Tax=Caulochytrium protostelioides TaxID=1555241 RepID=A0A4P9X556_9FUNG|nr:hypothetical protein CXG81DRAFT_27015 [Caulochytrium protostelioides]|eukprot:RKP00257.1 hypothetical protein CXG81DRAFT_27015 [Caulochytrium protostelioides]
MITSHDDAAADAANGGGKRRNPFDDTRPSMAKYTYTDFDWAEIHAKTRQHLFQASNHAAVVSPPAAAAAAAAAASGVLRPLPAYECVQDPLSFSRRAGAGSAVDPQQTRLIDHWGWPAAAAAADADAAATASRQLGNPGPSDLSRLRSAAAASKDAGALPDATYARPLQARLYLQPTLLSNESTAPAPASSHAAAHAAALAPAAADEKGKAPMTAWCILPPGASDAVHRPAKAGAGAGPAWWTDGCWCCGRSPSAAVAVCAWCSQTACVACLQACSRCGNAYCGVCFPADLRSCCHACDDEALASGRFASAE